MFELCKENKIDLYEEYIMLPDLKIFDEFFITGTLTEIAPIIQIDNYIIRDGKPGITTRKIQELFFKVLR